MNENILVVSPFTGATYELNEDQIKAAYYHQQWQFRYEDAKNHIECLLNEVDDNKDDFKEEFGVNYDDLLDCADVIADRFLDEYDCDTPENDQFDSIIQDQIEQLKRYGK